MATFNVGDRVKTRPQITSSGVVTPPRYGVVVRGIAGVVDSGQCSTITDYDPAFVATLVSVAWFTDGAAMKNTLPYGTGISSLDLDPA